MEVNEIIGVMEWNGVEQNGIEHRGDASQKERKRTYEKML